MKRNNFSLRKKSTAVHKPKEETDKLCFEYRKKIFETLFQEDSFYDHDHMINVDETIPRDSRGVILHLQQQLK